MRPVNRSPVKVKFELRSEVAVVVVVVVILGAAPSITVSSVLGRCPQYS